MGIQAVEQTTQTPLRRLVYLLFPLLLMPSAAFGASIAGTVRYYGSGDPVSGVTIELIGPSSSSVETDSNGAFNFGNLASSTWQIVPRRSGGAESAVSALDAVR